MHLRARTRSCIFAKDWASWLFHSSTIISTGQRQKTMQRSPSLLYNTSYVLRTLLLFYLTYRQELETRIGSPESTGRPGFVWEGIDNSFSLWIKFTACALIWKWVLLPVFGGKVLGNFKYPQERRGCIYQGHLVLFTKVVQFCSFQRETKAPSFCHLFSWWNSLYQTETHVLFTLHRSAILSSWMSEWP